MAFLILIIGVIILIVAIRGTYGDLARYLIADIPGYLKWALAIVAILALGYAPPLRTFSRGLLALVAIVILLTQWKNLQAGLAQFGAAAPATTGAGQVAADTTSGSATQPIANTNAQLASAALNINAAGTGAVAAQSAPFNPQNFAMLGSSLVNMASGFGGIA